MDEPTADMTDSADNAEDALTARAAAAILGVNERTVRRAIIRGELFATKYAGKYQIAPVQLELFRRRLTAPTRFPQPSRKKLNHLVAGLRQVTPEAGTKRLPLPEMLGSLIGRDDEVRCVCGLLRSDGIRLVTLVGPGGVGKSSLALVVAAELSPDFPDGVRFVSLAPVRNPTLIPTTIVRALGVVERADRSPIEILRSILDNRRILLVLDNFEHVLPAAPLIADLLTDCLGLSTLVTSRARLNLSEELAYEVPPLELTRPPPLGIDLEHRVESVGRAPAIDLFVTRARAVNSTFQLSEENAKAVAEVCKAVDGLPLGIELAAARIRHLTPTTMLTRMESRLQLLTGGPVDQPMRLRAMANTIAWSHDLLSDEEQILFRRLGVFIGGFSLTAAEAVCRGSVSVSLSPNTVFDGLCKLVDHHLVAQFEHPIGETRFIMLETIREFALGELEHSGESPTVRRGSRQLSPFRLSAAGRSSRRRTGPNRN